MVSVYNFPKPYLDILKELNILLSEMYPMIYERKRKENNGRKKTLAKNDKSNRKYRKQDLPIARPELS
jgi:hypothetical protein